MVRPLSAASRGRRRAGRASLPSSFIAGISAPGLSVVGIVDPGAQRSPACCGAAPAPSVARLIRCVRSGPKRPVGDGAAHGVAVDAGGRLEDARARPPTVGSVAAGARCAATQRSNSVARLRRRRAAACARAACRSTRRTARGRAPGSRGAIHMRLVRFGITSVLPASRGTQKLCTTSADSSVEEGRRGVAGVAHRHVQLVGGDDAEVRVADLPPPLMADHASRRARPAGGTAPCTS